MKQQLTRGAGGKLIRLFLCAPKGVLVWISSTRPELDDKSAGLRTASARIRNQKVGKTDALSKCVRFGEEV